MDDIGTQHSLTDRNRGRTRAIAVRQRSGDSPGLFWLGGFKSDMQGTKARGARPLGAGARAAPVMRFDYSGHGESGGDFTRRHASAAGWTKASRSTANSPKARRW